tara:strand:+ start:263 stop:1729 length:1467 start_codon:yes stop_codon:yes gene_type:complete
MLNKMRSIIKNDVFLLLLSITLYVTPFISFNLFPLNWIFFSIILYLLIIKKYNPVLLGFLFGLLSILIGQYWLTETLISLGKIPTYQALIVHILYASYESIFFIILFVFSKKLIDKNKENLLINYLLIIFFWIIVENIFPRIFPYRLGNTQILFYPLNQMISFFGINFLSIIILIINIIFFELYKLKKIKIFYFICTIMVLFIYSDKLLAQKEYLIKTSESLRISIIQPNNKKENLIKLSSQNTDNIDLYVWPESSIEFIDLNIKNNLNFLRNRINFKFNKIIFGSITKKGEDYFNSALVMNKNFNLVDYKNKKELLIYGEYYPFKKIISKLIPRYDNFIDLKKGKDKFIKIKEDIFAEIYICYEDLFENSLSDNKTDKDSGLLINITNDIWYGDSIASYQHLMLSIPRSLEQNKFFIRSANNGISAVISPNGKILRKIEADKVDKIIFDLPIIKQKTFYYENKKNIYNLFYLTFIVLIVIKKFINKF